jgi:outer membrane beta-barrel protein
MLPLDAFKKGITASGSLTLHYDHLWAWEAAQLTHSFEYKTALEDVLRAQGGLEATPFERVQTYVTSNVVFKPFYWKGAWMNQGLSYGELFFVAGGGYGWLTQSSRPVVDAGTGVRLFQGEWSARLDIRWLSFFNADDVQGELWVALGVSL